MAVQMRKHAAISQKYKPIKASLSSVLWFYSLLSQNNLSYWTKQLKYFINTGQQRKFAYEQCGAALFLSGAYIMKYMLKHGYYKTYIIIYTYMCVHSYGLSCFKQIAKILSEQELLTQWSHRCQILLQISINDCICLQWQDSFWKPVKSSFDLTQTQWISQLDITQWVVLC